MSKLEIHPQAVVAASAKLAPSVKVGAYAIVGDEAELGEGCIAQLARLSCQPRFK